MPAFQSTFEELLQSWKLRLQHAEAGETGLPARLETCIRICEESLLELRQWVMENYFPDRDSEICFFKQVKPVIKARYIYYQKVHRLHTGYFNGSGLLAKDRLEKELHDLARYFTDNDQFYTYYRNGSTHHDELYFVRGQYDWKICPEVNHFDNLFSTSFDGKLAELMANELLMKYVDERLNPSLKLAEPTPSYTTAPVSQTSFPCSISKTDVVEIGYAFYTAGVFGKAPLKEVMGLLSRMFQINLENYAHKFFQIRERKNSPTKFLDELKTSLVRYFDQLDLDK